MADRSADGSSDHVYSWWRHGVVYQVYIRSFADGNGDGTGDITGLRSRLPYLRDLGVDAVWVTPWYPSPLKDGGYDVVDPRDIDPRFGTLADAEAFIADAHRLGLRVIVDVVPNHTSDRHVWFQEALASPPGHPSRDRYLFRDGCGPGGVRPPSDWQSVFGGPAWEPVGDGQWYLHLFDVSQPDLNWRHPEVLADFEHTLRFWLDRGVDGFRVDVAHGLAKDQTFPDIGERPELLGRARVPNHPHWDRDDLHGIVRSWRAVLDSYDDRMMVAEAWVQPERLPLYLRPDEYHQSFNFALLETDWVAQDLRDVILRSHRAAADVDATSTWVLSNHDVMRHATRYGLPPGTDWRSWPAQGPHDVLDPELGERRARAAALLLFALPGAAYVYQGEELGLPEVWDLPPEVLDDPKWQRSGHLQKGRDGCRVPIPWEPSGPSLGFGDGPGWLPQPARFGPMAAAVQDGDPGSMLELYRSALAVRRQWFAADEELERIDLGADVVAFRRGSGAACVLNVGDRPVELPDGRVLVSSVPLDAGLLPPDAAVLLALG